VITSFAQETLHRVWDGYWN